MSNFSNELSKRIFCATEAKAYGRIDINRSYAELLIQLLDKLCINNIINIILYYNLSLFILIGVYMQNIKNYINIQTEDLNVHLVFLKEFCI